MSREQEDSMGPPAGTVVRSSVRSHPRYALRYFVATSLKRNRFPYFFFAQFSRGGTDPTQWISGDVLLPHT